MDRSRAKAQDRRGAPDRKDLQVCRQVFDALHYALAELDDPVVDELVLVTVVPAPSASRVLAILAPSRRGVDLDAAYARLREAADELRQEVAAEVSRRRVPELVFRIDPVAADDDR
ncbi:MAG: ribosome-binding factor A [Kofleriaceae bacterium]|jgi:ribosome-binding factor A|nr:ribosome-binding factor A [Kofleriaceae bacterium]